MVADRFDRRIVGALAGGVDLLIALTLALATLRDALTLPLLFAPGALHGAARVFVGPALSCDRAEHRPAALLPRAIAMSSIAWQVGSVVGPALAACCSPTGPTRPTGPRAGLLVVSAPAVLASAPMPLARGNRDVHPVRQIVDGFKYVWNERFLLGCITLDLFAVLLGGATALLPVFARDILHVGSRGPRA